MVADDEKKHYDDCCEVFRRFDKDGRIMKRVAITFYISLAVSVIAIFLLNDVDAFFACFPASVMIIMSIEAFDNKKLAVIAVPLYVASAIAVHRAMLLFIGHEKPLNAQVVEIIGLTGIMAIDTTMIKTIFLDNKPRKN